MLDHSNKWIKSKSIKYRKELGQYFTPDNIKDKLLELLPKMENAKILEPSIGTGEFVDGIYRNFKNCTIDAYDIDEDILNLIPNSINKVCKSFLEIEPIKKYDYIIGNPPYGTECKEISKKFNDIISGRVNIYALFIRHALNFLKDDGYLAFVVPTSMNNGKYFAKLRSYIVGGFEVENIINFKDDEFIDAQQNVQIIIIKKSPNTGKNIFKWRDEVYFTKDYKKMYLLSKGKLTLKEMGYRVRTGSVVWNQNKELLTDDSTKRKLIWSNNIKDGKIVEYKHDIKKQFISIDKCDIFPAIVVNRITGIGSNLNIKAAIINEPFLAENHVNVITAIKSEKRFDINYIFERINSEDSKVLLKSLMGNTQVSKTELENLIIFD